MKKKIFHEPVLAKEVIDFLNFSRFAHSKKRGKLVDATFGFGGYEKLMLNLNLDVLGIEVDPRTLKEAKKVVADFNKGRLNCRLVQGNFRDIKKIAQEEGFSSVDAVIFDLGVSSFQLDSSFYGFSFKYLETPLDMRLEKDTNKVRACDLLNGLSEKQLTRLFEVVLEKKLSRKLAKKIIERRSRKIFVKVADLLEVVDQTLVKRGRINPATKVFLALRMAVNSEIENLKLALPDSFSLIRKGGRLLVISFHSGEDRVVKSFFKDLSELGVAFLVNKKPIVPSRDEIGANPRCRSAKLRVIEKI